ncbi:MAG: PKD domain-containing protein, partial [Marmoricola sp.]
STGPVYTGPSGWQEVLSQNGSSSTARLYSKTATASDLGSSVTVTSRNADTTAYYVRSDTTLAAYRGVGSPAIKASAITAQNVASAVHQTPTVTATDGTSWLVSYWTDKSSTTTAWTGPASQTERSLGTATGSSHMSSYLMDSNARVNSGGQGGLNATANSSAQGLTMSVLLSGGTPPPANQSPTANASVGTCTNLTCSFDGASSVDPEGGALTYDWDWGDGTAHGTTATPSHTFTGGGVKNVTLTVTDPQGGTGSDSVSTPNLTAAPVNQAPTAHITGRSCTNLVCSFDGSTSTDPNPDTLTYSWNFGDGSPAVTTQNPSHTYATAGQKTVTLTVSDGQLSDDESTTFTVTAPPVNTAPTARITNPGCTNLVCSFTGSTSTDPDNDQLTYNWDFGDNSTDATTQNASHTYATAGSRTVTLTVNDGQGHSHSDTTIVNPTAANPGVSNVTFVASAGSVSNGTVTPTVTLPAGVQVGDTMLLFLGAASSPRTYSDPSGWTLLESEDGASAMSARAWTKTATQADTQAGVRVSVTASATTKTEMTVAVYRGTDGTTPIASSASKLDSAAGAAHTSPGVTATGETNWLVTYWADRSDTTTAWTAPAAATVRRTAAGTGSSHVAALLGDSNGPVTSGAQGQLTATANGASTRGASFSILLKSS